MTTQRSVEPGSAQRKNDALQAVREIIFSGELKEGAIFSENVLASRLGVSRTPIREAVTTLENRGLVEKIPQVGVRVRSFADADLRELFEARGYLEPHAGYVLAQRASDEDLDVLDDLLRGMERDARRGHVGEFLRKDVEFHWQTANLAGLPLFTDWIRQTGDRIRIVGFISTPTSDGMKTAIEEHARILDAIRARDPEGAASACAEHLDNTKKRIEAGYRRTIFAKGAEDV